MSMLRDFRDFAVKGNVIDLAVAVIIGAAFGKIVDSLVKDLIMPVIGRIFGGLDFANYFIMLAPPPAGYSGPVYRVNAELLSGIAARPDGWTALLTRVPGGLAVKGGSPAAAMLGMKDGDRMTQANGVALTGIEDLQAAFVKPLMASQTVHVAGVRDGKPAAWLFVNAGVCPG